MTSTNTLNSLTITPKQLEYYQKMEKQNKIKKERNKGYVKKYANSKLGIEARKRAQSRHYYKKISKKYHPIYNPIKTEIS